MKIKVTNLKSNLLPQLQLSAYCSARHRRVVNGLAASNTQIAYWWPLQVGNPPRRRLFPVFRCGVETSLPLETTSIGRLFDGVGWHMGINIDWHFKLKGKVEVCKW